MTMAFVLLLAIPVFLGRLVLPFPATTVDLPGLGPFDMGTLDVSQSVSAAFLVVGSIVLALEIAYPWTSHWYRRGENGVDRVRASIAPLKQIPGAFIGVPLLFLGLGLGVWIPDGVQWLGNGVETVILAIVQSAPYIIFFTLTPAISGVLAAGRAGKFALWVNLAFMASTIGAGILALIMVVPIFGVRLSGRGASQSTGPGTNIMEVIFTSPPFIGVLLAVGLALLIRPAGLHGVKSLTRLVGGKCIDLLGDTLKILLPLILFSLGVFIPTRVKDAVDKAKEAGDISGTGWIGPFSPEVAYFFSTAVMGLLLAMWIILLATVIMRYTKFPLATFWGRYFPDVASYAFATSTSAACIPINLERAGSVLKVRPHVREFILPLGATVNLDGTMIGGMTLAVVAAQMVGYTPTLLDLIFIFIPLVILTIGIPGIPGGLAVVASGFMSQVFPLSVEQQAAFIAIFVGFNLGISDMFRTVVNTVDNAIIARLFEYWFPKKFSHYEEVSADTPGAAAAY